MLRNCYHRPLSLKTTRYMQPIPPCSCVQPSTARRDVCSVAPRSRFTEHNTYGFVTSSVRRKRLLGCRFVRETRPPGSTVNVPINSAKSNVFGGIQDGNKKVPEMFQAALSTLDLYPAQSSFDSFDEELADAQADSHEDISLEHQQTAASVGRAVYEVLRIDQSGKVRRIYVRRRDLLRAYKLQPRDLRRIDPSLSPTKTSPTVTVKENVLLVNVCGLRAIISAEKCLLFEPHSSQSRKFLEIVTPRLQASAGAKIMQQYHRQHSSMVALDEPISPPYELEMLEGALMVATGRLDNELLNASRRVQIILQKLPRDINPVNLEELRRVKQLLVELESKADNLRSMLEELMDDEDDLRDINLSSRPLREEKRRQRERDRLEREMESMRDMAEEAARRDSEQQRGLLPSSSSSSQSSSASQDNSRSNGTFDSSSPEASSLSSSLSAVSRNTAPAPSSPWRPPPKFYLRRDSGGDGRDRRDRDDDMEDVGSYHAEMALEEMAEAEEEERELEEVEDLLEYYVQRATNTQSEAEKLLAGARDLEESIGVSLSARRYEVNRLELTLSISSFAAAVGAMIAGIFGMNLRSTMEMSVVGFWGITAAIVVGCVLIFLALYRYTKKKRIL